MWKRIFQNSLLLLSARILSKLATIAVMVAAARMLGTASFGEFSALLAWTAFVGLLSDFGLVLPTIRSLSSGQGTENRWVGETFSSRVAWSGAALACLAVTSVALNLSLLVAMLLAVSSILEATGTALIRSFESKQEMATITIYTVIERLSYCVTVFGALALFGSLTAVGVASVLSYSWMTAFALRLFQKRFGRLSARFSWNDVKKYSKTGFPFLVSAGFGALYYKADIIMIGSFRSNEEVGIYNAAMRVMDAQIFIPLVLMASIFPTLSRLHSTKDIRFVRTFLQSLALFSTIGIGLTVVVYLLSPLLIPVLFSRAYERAIPVLQTLSLMQLFYFLYYLFGHGLIAMKKEAWYTASMVSLSLINVACNIFVIPRYGYLGAAWTRVASEALLSAVTGLFVFYHLRRSFRMTTSDRPLSSWRSGPHGS